MASSKPPVLKGALLRSTASLQSDTRLVEMVRAGVEPAFNTIVERYRSPLLRYATRMVDADRAEDVVQEALMKAHGSLLQDDREIQLKPWLYRITHNLALDAVRQKSWNYDQLDDNYDGVRQPPDYLEQKERLRSIIEHMDTLPERQRRALILQAFEGRSSEEIARELDDGVPEARQLVHRARTRMRNAFGALIPMPVLLWLNRGTAYAATTSTSGGKILLGSAVRTGIAKFATTAAIAVVIGAGAGVVVGETTIRGGGVNADQVANVSPAGDADTSTASGGSSSGKKTSGSKAGGSDSHSAAGAAPGANSDGTNGSANEGDHPSSGNADATEAPSAGGDTRPSAGSPEQPSSGSGSTGGGSNGSGSTGSGSTGSGSTGSGGGSTGGGGGGTGSGGGSTGGGSTGGDQTCIGPIATLPPICLPDLNSGSGNQLPKLPKL